MLSGGNGVDTQGCSKNLFFKTGVPSVLKKRDLNDLEYRP